MNGKQLREVEAWMIFPTAEEQPLREDYVRVYTARDAFARHGGLQQLQHFVDEPYSPPPMMGSKPAMAAKPAPGVNELRRKPNADMEFAQHGLESIESLIAQPPKESLAPAIARGSRDGLLAGYCVVLASALQEREYKTAAGNRANASLNVVSYVCEKMLSIDVRKQRGRPSKSTGARLPANAQQLKVLHRHYRALAPLWAAYLHLQEHPQPSPLEPGFLRSIHQAFWTVVPHYQRIVATMSAPSVLTDLPERIGAMFAGGGSNRPPEADWWHKHLELYTRTYSK